MAVGRDGKRKTARRFLESSSLISAPCAHLQDIRASLNRPLRNDHWQLTMRRSRVRKRIAMNCRDCERIWNELIETSSPIAGDSENALSAHAAGCPTCRQRAAGYQALRQAILAWGPPPAAPAALADRILVAARVQAPSVWQGHRPWRAVVRLRRSRPLMTAVAASILAVITVGVITKMTIDPSRGRHRVASAPPETKQSGVSDSSEHPRLNEALASATEATWDLARSASEPAARLSRQFLDAATESETEQTPAASAAVSVPSLNAFAPDSAAAVATIQQVGDRLASGFGSLSSTARHAFGFLLGPAPPKPDIRANPPAARGA